MGRKRWLYSAMVLWLGAGLPAEGAHTRARLILSLDEARPGDTVEAGIDLEMDPGWHTYWKNSGAAGMPTTIAWKLPPGVTAGKTQWPVPEKLPDEALTTYIYKDEVVLLTALKIGTNVTPGPLQIKADVSWLECQVQCVPGEQAVEAPLRVGNESRVSKGAGVLETWAARLPKAGTNLEARAWWGGAARGQERSLLLHWKSRRDVKEADFYPASSEKWDVGPGVERVPAAAGTIEIRKEVKKLSGDWPGRVSGLLVQEVGKDREAYEVDVPVGSAESPAAAPVAGIWWMLLYAFLGGLILNVMPCVLPVIALKILGFVSQSKEDPGRVKKLGLLYGLGVLVSFLTLAALVIGVQAAGHRAGWGMQFGSPEFLIVLTVLVTLVALNLFGLFEVNLGGRTMDAAGSLASKHGAAGAFFNGVLATVLATPCTAPFLGAALGFAFTQSAGMIVLMFVVVALGLAAPYVLLSFEPRWLGFLPKPGKWMERFKVAMGFPMLATAVWLFSLLPGHYGARAWWVAIFLVVVAFAAWIYGEFVQRGRRYRGVGLAVALLLVLGGYAYIVEGQLQWRAPEEQAAGGIDNRGGIKWQPWSPDAVAKARSEGRPVLVDFTADWCLTCQANKRFAIDVPKVRTKLKEINAVALLGDYTRLPDDITAELNRYGRAGVPLVLVYPKDTTRSALVLPEALTPGIVLNALAVASR